MPRKASAAGRHGLRRYSVAGWSGWVAMEVWSVFAVLYWHQQGRHSIVESVKLAARFSSAAEEKTGAQAPLAAAGGKTAARKTTTSQWGVCVWEVNTSGRSGLEVR